MVVWKLSLIILLYFHKNAVRKTGINLIRNRRYSLLKHLISTKLVALLVQKNLYTHILSFRT